MKKNIYILFMIIAAMVSFSVLPSCDELNQPGEENTEQDNKIDEQYDLAPGTVITYEFTPSSVWTISISEESYKWFKIKAGNTELAILDLEPFAHTKASTKRRLNYPPMKVHARQNTIN